MGLGRRFREGEEMVFAQFSLETFAKIQQDVAEEMEITIRVKSCKYKDDTIHCELLKTYMKAKNDLLKREFEINNGRPSK